MNHIKDFDSLFESYMVPIGEVDELLDKISSSGITSLSDIEKNRLDLFSKNDEQVISIIERMADIMDAFKNVNDEIKKLIDSNKEPLARSIFQRKWAPLNNEMSKIEKSLTSWGIDLADERIGKLLHNVRPSLFLSSIDDEVDESLKQHINEGIWAYSENDANKMMDVLRALKDPKEVNDKLYKEWWDKVGDDALYDILDRIKDEPENFKSQINNAIDRIKWLIRYAVRPDIKK